jgi:hypothetical protein
VGFFHNVASTILGEALCAPVAWAANFWKTTI